MDHQVGELTSGITGTTYRLLACEVGAAVARRPVVFVTDADNILEPAVEAASGLAAEGRLPSLLLVGAAYGGGFRSPVNRRGRDYTPTAMAGEDGTGGAGAFLRFLREELWPWLEARGGVGVADAAVFGHSIGALLALTDLWSGRRLFSRYVVSAPSVWYDERSILAIGRRHRDLVEELPVRLFLGVGTEDTPSMHADLALLEAQLEERPYRGLVVERARFAGRDHYDAVPDALRAGLEAVFRAG